jgi:hypothetical protein
LTFLGFGYKIKHIITKAENKRSKTYNIFEREKGHRLKALGVKKFEGSL